MRLRRVLKECGMAGANVRVNLKAAELFPHIGRFPEISTPDGYAMKYGLSLERAREDIADIVL